MAESIVKLSEVKYAKANNNSKELIKILRENKSDEVVFAVVGYAGSGTSFVISQLSSYLKTKGHNPVLIKARSALENYAHASGNVLPTPYISPIERTTEYQRIGDDLRRNSGEYGAVAAYMIKDIKNYRTTNAVSKTVYILDSLKHPQEVDLLKHVYGNSFCLIGVGCRPDIRTRRLQTKFKITDSKDANLKKFVERDAEDSEHKYGQQVNDTFHRSDYFVDNTPNCEDPLIFKLPDELKRLYDIVFTGAIHRPRSEERGMFHANAAAMRSSCLSRQVGASILDSNGDLISVGANEVPKFGGGSYDESNHNDDRCFRIRG